jgi:hypothetical protein
MFILPVEIFNFWSELEYLLGDDKFPDVLGPDVRLLLAFLIHCSYLRDRRVERGQDD